MFLDLFYGLREEGVPLSIHEWQTFLRALEQGANGTTTVLDAGSRDLIIETIDGQPSSGSRHIDAFLGAGLRRGTTGLRFYRRV